MVKQLKDDSIGPNDFLDYLNGFSDFSFELRTLALLKSHGLDCEHGGLYEDPVTGKARAFDIRAVSRTGAHCVRLAVECKNISEHYPLLVSQVPRSESESYHEVAFVTDMEASILAQSGAPVPRARVVRLHGVDSFYKPFSPVGKSLAQIGRTKDGAIVASDAEVFDKWSQCLASADDLVSRCYWENNYPGNTDDTFTMVIPILVVPDGRLWAVEYGTNGDRKSEPQSIDHCSVFIDKSYKMNKGFHTTFSMSHLELMTTTGLSEFVKIHLMNDAAMKVLFPAEIIYSAVKDQITSEG